MDTENGLVVTREEGGWGWTKQVKDISFMVMANNWIYSCDHSAVYTDVKL